MTDDVGQSLETRTAD